MARILWIACAQPGSLYPAVPIALELARRGHEVTVLCEPSSRETFERLGFAFRPARDLAAVEPPESGRGRAGKLAWHARYVRALYADTSRALEAGQFDAVMVDPLEPGADFAAEAAGVPSFSYVHWRMSETGGDVPFCFHFWDRERPAEEAFVEWWNEQRALVGLAPDPRPPQEHRWYRHSRGLTLILGLPELVSRRAICRRTRSVSAPRSGSRRSQSRCRSGSSGSGTSGRRCSRRSRLSARRIRDSRRPSARPSPTRTSMSS